jgi:anthranilate synthase component 2
MMMKLLVLDNYDSFTYNLVHLIDKIAKVDIDVFRNDKISVAKIAEYDKVVLSPGPGIPEEAGILKEVISKQYKQVPMLGVCLGHQAIGEVFGGKLVNLDRVHHGVATEIEMVKDDYLFTGLPKSFMVGRYHSWVIDSLGEDSGFEITAVDGNGEIMAIAHKEYDIRGVQFHPESILTEYGEELMSNWLKHE